MKIGLVPVSAKPYHAGHHYLIETAASKNDKVIVYASTSDRKRKGEFPVSGRVMQDIWVNEILQLMPENVDVVFGGSPVRKVYEAIGDAWVKSLPDEDQKKLAAGEEPEIKEEGVIREDKFPAPGTIKGGGKDPVGQALAFLVKGKHDGNQSDDSIDVEVAGTLDNSDMIPTQSNILAAKSLLFAFLQGTGNSDLSDMGGAFVTSDGEILDGHHRWSGAYIGTGGNLTHNNVHIVAGKADELLPALTAIGNAIGRQQKESKKSADDILMERWRSLAGLL